MLLPVKARLFMKVLGCVVLFGYLGGAGRMGATAPAAAACTPAATTLPPSAEDKNKRQNE